MFYVRLRTDLGSETFDILVEAVPRIGERILFNVGPETLFTLDSLTGEGTVDRIDWHPEPIESGELRGHKLVAELFVVGPPE
jgi:hypothetical protein